MIRLNPFFAMLVVTLVGTVYVTFLQNKILAFSDDLGAMVNPISGSTQTASHSQKVQTLLYSPQANTSISTPVNVKGKAPGNWYFEATLGIKILDADGTMLGQGPATAEGDWMVKGLVPFSATIPFSAPHSDTGFVVIEADDPAGFGNPPTLKVPVTFSAAAGGAFCTSTIAGACAPSDQVGS